MIFNMTQEEKAQAYDEAIKRASKLRVQNPFDTVNQMMEHIFPELKESEDEIIRKMCMKYLDRGYQHCSFADDRKNIEKCIAWLEKQGAQTHAELSHSEVTKISDQELEPKFHGCEWITNGDYTWKILGIKPLDYILQSQDGNIVDDTISYVDEHFHLWSIQDAKDGDVLVCNINKAEIGGDIEKLPNITPAICIYQNVEKDSDYIHCYCSLYDGKSLVLSNAMYYNTFVYNIHPATKEQRDLLFQKIKEAGCEWDAENKYVKKIEL